MQDIHTHLYWQSYDVDRDAVIARAHEAGVDRMFTIGCTVEESRQCVALAEKHPEIYASVGIHPHFFNEFVEKEFSIFNSQFSNKDQFIHDAIQTFVDDLRHLAKHEKVVAIGECGLDYYAHETGKGVSDEQRKIQKEGFLAQIELARELKLPMILHCRPSFGTQDAYDDLFLILQSKIFNLTSAILHCYMGDTEVTQKFLTLPNVYFSFTGNITYPVKKVVVGTKDDLTETVRMIPLERMFAETDCPFLAPQAHRGERNEPAYVEDVIAQIALLQDADVEAVQAVFGRSVQAVFF